MTQTEERIGEVQESLIWTGHYDGLINGRMNSATAEAVRSFQAQLGHDRTGALSSSEFAELKARGSTKMRSVGFGLITDPATGIEIGLPQNLLERKRQAKRGTNWAADDDSINVDTLRFVDGRSLKTLYDTLRKSVPGRRLEYKLLRDDWFVLEGQDADGRRFYVRASTFGGDVRGFSVTYPKARKAEIFPIVIAMSNSFNPFPTQASSPVTPEDSPPPTTPEDSTPPPTPGTTIADAGEACTMFPGLC